MIKKTFYSLFFLSVFVSPLYAQKKMVYREVTQIDSSEFIYYYLYTFNERGKEEQAQMVLQVGNELQRFSSMLNYLSDSLALKFNNEPQDTKLLTQKDMGLRRSLDYHGDVRWELYTNYPKGKRSITDRVFMDRFVTVEEDQYPKWQLANEQKEISGRLCYKATTTLYGREWVAWYSEEYKRSDGPWLLRGLPGLVILAEDSTGNFSFQLYKMERRSTPILYNVRNYLEASRNDVLKAMKRYYDNKAQYVSATAVGEQMSDLPKTEPTTYTPLRKIIE